MKIRLSPKPGPTIKIKPRGPKKAPSVYISGVNGKEIDGNRAWHWDYSVSVGDRDKHNHMSFTLKDGKLQVFVTVSNADGYTSRDLPPMSFDELIRKIKG